MNVPMSVTESIPDIRDFKYSWLFYIFVLGLSLFVIGFVANALGHPTWAGFLAIYSVIAVIVSVFVYVVITLFRITAEWQS